MDIPDKQPRFFRKSMKTGNAGERYPLKCHFQVGIPSKISLLKELSSNAYFGIHRSAIGVKRRNIPPTSIIADRIG